MAIILSISLVVNVILFILMKQSERSAMMWLRRYHKKVYKDRMTAKEVEDIRKTYNN